MIPASLLKFINEGDSFLIAGHESPDGDCAGSQLALASALSRLGKKALAVSAGPFKRTEILSFVSRFAGVEALEAARGTGARVIIVDCDTPARTGDLKDALAGFPIAIIDHHGGADDPDGACVYRDPEAQATTMLVLALMDGLGLEPNREEAALLFFGLCTDTGFFRHVDDKGAPVFDMAARLTRLGANPRTAFRMISGGKSLASRLLIGKILARTESWYGGKLLVSVEELDDRSDDPEAGRDSDALYQALQAVAGMEVIVIIRQETEEKCALGFRSRDEVDVAKIARQFGGGGHKNAAGGSVPGKIPAVKRKIVDAFKFLS